MDISNFGPFCTVVIVCAEYYYCDAVVLCGFHHFIVCVIWDFNVALPMPTEYVIE